MWYLDIGVTDTYNHFDLENAKDEIERREELNRVRE